MRRLAVAAGAVAIAIIVTVIALLATTGSSKPEKNVAVVPLTTPTTNRAERGHPSSVPPAPATLTAARVALRAGPVAVPWRLEIPSIGVNASMLGVGITPGGAMDAPEGAAGDPVWQEAFWYRGSAFPGTRSTALIAGHIDGPNGSNATFTHLDGLHPGDAIVLHDNRSGLNVRFAVTGTQTYSLAQAAEPAVLKRIYGVGPVAGKWPLPSGDGLSHLTLITCAGTFRDGTHDHRLVVFATRVG